VSHSANPRPFQEKHTAEKYAEKRYKGMFQRLVNKREQAIAKRLLHAESGSQVHAIDLPCGYGRFYALLKELGFRVTALDQAEEMVRVCQKLHDFGDEDQAMTADVLKPLPAEAKDANVAFSARLFQHLHTSEVRVQALKTLGSNNRRVVMSYYDSGCLHYWTKRLAARLQGKRVRINMITREQFESEVATVGMRVETRIKLMPGIHAQTWVTLAPA